MYISLGVHHKVLRLYISMQYTVLMKKFQGEDNAGKKKPLKILLKLILQMMNWFVSH